MENRKTFKKKLLTISLNILVLFLLIIIVEKFVIKDKNWWFSSLNALISLTIGISIATYKIDIDLDFRSRIEAFFTILIVYYIFAGCITLVIAFAIAIGFITNIFSIWSIIVEKSSIIFFITLFNYGFKSILKRV